jgi:proteasome lid subunit RPN8/RPN11
MTLQLPESFARQIEREAQKTYPDECCGILYGRDIRSDAGVRRVVGRIERVGNEFEASERRRRFLITPDVMLRAQQEADRRGEEILGFYHSHPDAPARPSEFDREHAWGFYSYVIVSIAKGEAVDMTSWVLDDATRRFERQDIEEVG